MMTPKRKAVLDFIGRYMAREGCAPSYHEIMKEFGYRSTNSVFKHVRALAEEGYLKRAWNARRGIVLTMDAEDSGNLPDDHIHPLPGQVPLLGSIAAGRPLDAVEHREEAPLPAGNDKTYALRAMGDSMEGEGILDGDFLLVEPRGEVRDGEIVVALLSGGEATVKKFFRDPGRRKIRLEPANADYEPIYVDETDVRIQGVVTAVWRMFRRGGRGV
ncbi:MAG: transcriptional repressor LexA [Acidobacteriota bacterium]|nr:MAG: transcriptional repressor LexA [Acidobacteriota bacterium]